MKGAKQRIRAASELYGALLDRKRYARIFSTIEARVEKDRRYGNSFALYEELDLRWVLSRRRQVLRWVLGGVKRREYQVSPARETLSRIGEKERIFYRLEWPDRLLQMVLAQAVAECCDDHFHPRLFSYRKGRGAVQAARLAARFARSQPSESVFVLKRDVKSYGDRVPQDKLFDILHTFLKEADPFVRALLRQFIAFRYIGIDGAEHLKSVGLPTGMPLNCVLENVYMTPVDQALGGIPGVSYMRYGDDLWLSTRSLETARRLRDLLNDLAIEWDLLWHPDKSYDLCFERCDMDRSTCADFQAVPHVLHLGVSINRRGHIDIPPERLARWRKDLKPVLRRANLIARRLGLEGEERLRHIVHFANQFLNSIDGRFAKMDYLLTVVTHDQRFIEIDRWVAQSVLAAYYGRFSRCNFRRTPYSVLKRLGLESLYQRRQEMFAKAARRAKLRR